MGAKTCMLVLAESNAHDALSVRPSLDKDATLKLVTSLFPDEKLELIGEDGDLSYTYPPDDEIHIGCFPSVSIVAAKEFGIDYPSKLPQKFIAAGGNGVITFHAMHSAVDFFAYAIWSNGKLVCSLSLSPDRGIMEDIGQQLSFEKPYWSGEHPAVDDEDEYPFAFHPLELGEEALKYCFGYQLEVMIDDSLLEPESIPLVRYKRLRSSRWKFWRRG
jgi:hypothetical protein